MTILSKMFHFLDKQFAQTLKENLNSKIKKYIFTNLFENIINLLFIH